MRHRVCDRLGFAPGADRGLDALSRPPVHAPRGPYAHHRGRRRSGEPSRDPRRAGWSRRDRGRPRRERHLQPTGSCRRPQRALVHAELPRELIERQEFRVPRVLRHRHFGSLEPVRRNGSQSAVPHPKRIHGHVDERGKFLLREIGGARIKRPPAFQAGDHEPFRHDSVCYRNRPIAKCSAEPAIMNSRVLGADSPD